MPTDTHPAAELAPGTQIAGCRIEGVAGRGGMGVVYRATQLDLGRPVAVKVIAGERAQDPAFRARFAQEARLAASIDHPNVVPIHAAGEEDGRLYLVMRLVAGTDLHRLIGRDGPLHPARAAEVVAQVAAGLDAAHAAGLVHRDVKPANVLLSGQHVYLGDFGLTRVQAVDARITETGGWVGTAAYMAPELLAGASGDARADVYALGCVLCAALTGMPPFPRATVPATMHAHLHDPPPRPSEIAPVPRAFDGVVARALAKDPASRYPSAGDLGRAARAAALGEPVTDAERTVARGAAAPAPAPAASAPGAPAPASGAAAPAPGAAAPAPGAAGPAPGAAAPAATAATVAKPPTTLWRPPSQPGFAPRRVARARRRVVRVAAVVCAALVAGIAAAGVVLGRSGGVATYSTAPLSEVDVRGAVDRFAAAVASEDSAALGRVLARDVRRVFPTDAEHGRAAVLAAYRAQFRRDRVAGYELGTLTVQSGRVGRVSGRYTLRRTGRAPVSGRIVFGVVRERGAPRIALIAATPG